MLSDSYISITLSLSWTMKQNTGRVSLLLIIYSSINSENDQLLDIVGLNFFPCFYFLSGNSKIFAFWQLYVLSSTS